MFDAEFLGDLDDDGHREIVVGGLWAPGLDPQNSGEGGGLAALSGVSGNLLWIRYLEPIDSWAGINVLNAGVFDQDGTEDPAVLIQASIDETDINRLEVLSGKDGRLLSTFELPERWYSSMTSAGDLDRDGYDEILLNEGRSGVVSLRQQRLVNPARVWRTA